MLSVNFNDIFSVNILFFSIFRSILKRTQKEAILKALFFIEVIDFKHFHSKFLVVKN